MNLNFKSHPISVFFIPKYRFIIKTFVLHEPMPFKKNISGFQNPEQGSLLQKMQNFLHRLDDFLNISNPFKVSFPLT